MSKTDCPPPRKKYDFSGGVRGKYAARYAEGTNVALLDQDMAHFFPNSKAVNEALRLMLRIARDAGGILPQLRG